MRTEVYRLFADNDKEEQWLNEMAAKGWNLIASGVPAYTFEEGTPGEYAFRIILLKHKVNHPESISTIRFIEETGAEHVGSNWKWVYFRKKTGDGAFDIYTDTASLIQHYKRMANLLCLVGIVALLAAMSQIPFMVWSFFIRNSPWGIANLISAGINIFCLCWLYRPWARYRAKVKELEFEQDNFE